MPPLSLEFFFIFCWEPSAGGHLTLLTTSLAHFLPQNILFSNFSTESCELHTELCTLQCRGNCAALFAAPFSGSWVANSSPPLFARFRDRRVVREHQTAGQLQLVKQEGVGQLSHADRVDQMVGRVMVRDPDVRQHLRALVRFS